MAHWTDDTFFYHIYPLGACGAPHQNNFTDQPIGRIKNIHGWLDHIQSLGANAIYLGPVFESTSHGYDTANYYEVDRRLGSRSDLAALSRDIHQRGMRLVLDGVFNHVGRDFWAFKDLLARGQSSPYLDWFVNLRFDGRSPFGDPFTYEAWNGFFGLVKLNLANPEVREHLFGAVSMWTEEFQIDGIRLDAADALSFEFMRALRSFCDQLNPALWLMGEVIHGDYRNWANPHMLHSTTNYELYKGLYSSHNDQNYFELAYSLNREFGEEGLYKDLNLYNFVDNHDVSRIFSQLNDPADLFPLHILLFTVPGIPSVYYGSEFGFPGVKAYDDWSLRPFFDLQTAQGQNQQVDLTDWITRLADLQANLPPLRFGAYEQKLVASQQLVFLRSLEDERVLVMVNSDTSPAKLAIPMEGLSGWRFVDLLNENEIFTVSSQDSLEIEISPKSGRILKSAF
ncbi:MAG: alpha-amylase family glycosyl hydrolase [Anaerolineaceae bacterium]